MSLKHSTVAASPRPAAVSSYRRALILVTCLFFLWGLSYGLLDVLNKHFQDTLHVSKAQSGLLQSAYFGAYFVIALPAGLLMDKYGYKAGILLGLCLYAIGALLFMPAASAQSFAFFLFALFVIACGLGCLETAANPYATVLGAPQGAERRLNLAQSFNGLGQFFWPADWWRAVLRRCQPSRIHAIATDDVPGDRRTGVAGGTADWPHPVAGFARAGKCRATAQRQNPVAAS